jgi:Tfp pilus assembly protein PilV
MYDVLSTKRGISLLEILFTTVLLTIGTVSLFTAMASVKSGAVDSEMVTIGNSLARDMMDEIYGKAFEDPDGAVGSFGTEESLPRSNYDDVDDYDVWSQSPPVDVNGTAYNGAGGMPNYTMFTRAVTVENVPENNFNVGTPSADGSTDAKRIIVTVSWNAKGGSPQVQLRSVVTEYHPVGR